MKLTIIGGGNMGLTFAKGIHQSKILGAPISILEKGSENIAKLTKKEQEFLIYDTPETCVKEAEMIILAVKPFNASEVFESIRKYLNKDQVFISLMAGVTIATIKEGLNITKVVRTMPNLPAMIGKGITGFTASKEVTKKELATIEKILASTGESVMLSTEQDIDKITGLSGSGSAYVFYFMESMMNSAKSFGFSEEDAKKIVTQTFDGAVALFKQNQESTTEWINKVCSKGGTTIAAIDSFEKNKVKTHIENGVEAAYRRAVELGKEK